MSEHREYALTSHDRIWLVLGSVIGALSSATLFVMTWLRQIDHTDLVSLVISTAALAGVVSIVRVAAIRGAAARAIVSMSGVPLVLHLLIGAMCAALVIALALLVAAVAAIVIDPDTARRMFGGVMAMVILSVTFSFVLTIVSQSRIAWRAVFAHTQPSEPTV